MTEVVAPVGAWTTGTLADTAESSDEGTSEPGNDSSTASSYPVVSWTSPA